MQEAEVVKLLKSIYAVYAEPKIETCVHLQYRLLEMPTGACW